MKTVNYTTQQEDTLSSLGEERIRIFCLDGEVFCSNCFWIEQFDIKESMPLEEALDPEEGLIWMGLGTSPMKSEFTDVAAQVRVVAVEVKKEWKEDFEYARGQGLDDSSARKFADDKSCKK